MSRYSVVPLIVSAMLIAALGLFGFNLQSEYAAMEGGFLDLARSHHRNIVSMRRWNADYGGVYVEKKPGVESNPYLKAPDVTLTDGRVLTMRNPAMMTRELSEISNAAGHYNAHITSLKLKNKDNAPDEWERNALMRFEQGEKEFYERISEKGKSYFRYMAPLYVQESCLECHQDQNYQIGDVRGGISISLPVENAEGTFYRNAAMTGLATALIMLGLGGIVFWGLRRNTALRQQALREQARFEGLVQTVDGIVWEADAQTFQFTFVSQKAESMLGYSVDEWKAPGFWLSHLHPDDRSWAQEYCADRIGRIEPHDFEYRFIARDGRTVWLHDLVSVVGESGEPQLLRGLMIDVTRRKTSEAQAEKVKAEQAVLLNNVLVGIVFVRNREIVNFNPRFGELFGYDRAELLGQSTRILYPTEEFYYEIGAKAYPVVATGQAFSHEVPLRHKSGRVFWGVLTGQALDPEHPHEGSIWIYADISAQKLAEEEANKLLRAVEQSPVSIVITDRDGVIEYVNPRFSHVTGYARHEAIGQNPRLLQSGATPKAVYEELWSTILSGKEWRGRLQNRRKNGEIFWEEASIAPILSDEKEITHFIAVKEDISDRLRVEQELEGHRNHLEEEVRSRTQDLALAMQKALSADRAKTEFLTNMSHEIRTPLNAILGFSALMMHTTLNYQQRDYVSKIDGAGHHLLDLINNLLDISKIAAGRAELSEVEFELPELLAQISSVVAFKAEEKGLHFSIDLAPEVPARLFADRLRLNQVLINLINNAIKFTEYGQVKLTVACKNCSGSLADILFVVSDTGIGMSAEDLERVFDPFVQADASITRKYGGTGLGLAISRQLVELMGGTLQVQSTEGAGSTFEFSLPIKVIASASTDSHATSTDRFARNMRYEFSDVRVLLVEDQALNRQVAVELLASVGVEVDIATQGQEAIDQLMEKGPDYYDAVFMDVQMPVLDGLSAISQIRSRSEYRDLPIIAMTAHVLDEECRKIAAAGANDHLGKPFPPDLLYSKLASWVAPDKTRQIPRTGLSPSQKNVAEPSSEILNWPEGLARFDGNTERYALWLERFVKDNGSFSEDIQEMLRAGDRAGAAKRVHALKGVSGTLGLMKVHSALGKLEKHLGENDAPCEREIAALSRALTAAFLLIAQRLDDQKTDARDLPPVSAAERKSTYDLALYDALVKLQEMLHVGNGDSGEWADACLKLAKDTPFFPQMKCLAAEIAAFDFAAAEERLTSMLGNREAPRTLHSDVREGNGDAK